MKRIWTLMILFGWTVPAFGQASYSSPETGTKVLGSYFATDIDTVSHTNGNLHVNIPLFSLPGRELPLKLGVDYNSQFYEYRQVANPGGGYTWFWDFTGWRKDTGIGGTLKAARVQTGAVYEDPSPYKYAKFKVTATWIDSLGTKHEFVKTDVTFPCTSNSYGMECSVTSEQPYDYLTIDSTGSEFERLETGNYLGGSATPAQPRVTFKNGTVFTVTERILGTPNGNRLTGDSSTQTTNCTTNAQLGDYLPLSDTTGRTISFTNGNTQVVTLDPNGQPKTYRITFASIPAYNSYQSLDTNFCVVTSIELPNGKTYQFEYETAGNSKGMLKKITFPSHLTTKAYVQYTYSHPNNAYPWVAQRIVSADGTAGSEKTWSYAYQFSGGSLIYTTITDPTGAKQVHTFSGGLNTGTTFKSSTDVVLKKVDRNWQSGNDARINWQTTTLGHMVSQTVYTYGAYNTLTKEEHYDYGEGAPGGRIRYIDRTYTSNTSLHILGKITGEYIISNGGNLIARTEYEYDNYADPNSLVTRSGNIPGWVSPGSNPRGNVTAIKRWRNTDNTLLVTTQRYDVLGNLVKVTDPMNHATETDYTDNFTQPPANPTFAYLTKVTNALGQFTQTQYNFQTGLVTQTTDLRGFNTVSTYDSMNRLASVTEPNGKVTTYCYSDTSSGNCYDAQSIFTVKEVTKSRRLMEAAQRSTFTMARAEEQRERSAA